MKNREKKRKQVLMVAMLLTGLLTCGCSRRYAAEERDDMLAENVVITETGEVIEKPTPTPTAQRSAHANTKRPTDGGEQKTTPVVSQQEAPTPVIDVDIPVQEQIITEEDQIEPQGHNLQMVFLGDSIFDNNRDGTGVPYLTAVQCDADVYNLAIGGTSASIESDEQAENEKWTSRSLCGVVNALLKKIPTGIFEGSRTGEMLNNPNIDFSQTDYFIVEYGTNDFFRGVRQSDLIGDGNITNNGNGTLFDYKGTCNYVANEQNTLFLNAYQDLGIDGYTAEQYLEDGVHLSAEGRQLYADALAKIILNYEETKNKRITGIESGRCR